MPIFYTMACKTKHICTILDLTSTSNSISACQFLIISVADLFLKQQSYTTNILFISLSIGTS